MNFRRIIALAYKEWREILRDRMFFGLAFLVPPFLMLVLGHGLRLDVENIPLVIVDYDRTSLSREYAHRIADSRYFDFQGYASHESHVAPLITDNRARAAIIIPEHFKRRLLAGRRTAVQTIIDGSRPFRAETTKGYITAMNAAFNRDTVQRYIARVKGISPDRAQLLTQAVALKVRYLYNNALRSAWAIAPSLMMLVLMLTPPLLTAVGVVREKESGSIDNIYSSTLTHGEFLIGKLVPYVLIASFNILILWAIVIFVFGAPFKGAPLLFYGITVVYVLCTTCIGLVISLLVRTQIAAILITTVISMIPTFLYSGMIVPISSLSPGGRLQSQLLPATHFNRITQKCFLKGVGFDLLWPDLLALVVYTAALFSVGYLLFSKRPRT